MDYYEQEVSSIVVKSRQFDNVTIELIDIDGDGEYWCARAYTVSAEGLEVIINNTGDVDEAEACQNYIWYADLYGN